MRTYRGYTIKSTGMQVKAYLGGSCEFYGLIGPVFKAIDAKLDGHKEKQHAPILDRVYSPEKGFTKTK